MSKYDDLSWLGQATQASEPKKNNEESSGYDQSYSEQESVPNVPSQQWEEAETPANEETPSNNWGVQNFFESNQSEEPYRNPFAPQGYEYPQEEQPTQPPYQGGEDVSQDYQYPSDESFTQPPQQNREMQQDWGKSPSYDDVSDAYEAQSQPPMHGDINDSEDFSALFGNPSARQNSYTQNTAPGKSKSQRKLEKTNKRERRSARKKARESEGQSNFALIFARILGVIILVALVVVLSMNQIRNAQELKGSTTSTSNISQVTTSNNVLDFYEKNLDSTDPNMPTADDDDINEFADNVKYKYIDETMLDAKTPTDLAVWYILEFAEAEVKNEEEYKEFNNWVEKKTQKNPEFAAMFHEALVYANAHPELLHPEIMDEPEEIAQDSENPDSETSAEQSGTGTDAQPEQQAPSAPDSSASGETTETTPPQSTTPQPSGNTGYESYQENSQTTVQLPDLSHMTAAQVANWVYATFPPSESNWDYALLTAYYNWASAKQNSDPSFISSINGYLSIMGWAAD